MLLILGLVMPIVFSLLISSQKSAVDLGSRDSAVGSGGIISEALSRQVHAATVPPTATAAIKSATATDLDFYSSLGQSGGPAELNITVATACAGCSYDNLVETVTQPYNSGSPKTSVIETGIVPPAASTPLFQYFDAASNQLNPSPALSSTQLGEVENITVTFATLDPLRAAVSPKATFTQQMTLPNVDYYNESTTTTTAP